jgi:GTP-binding protein
LAPALDGRIALRVEAVEAGRIADCPRGVLPEVAVSGRSNVGKSSLLNTLLGRKGLARISKTPGKTQILHFFRVNDAFHLVDLPGYGYARVPAKVLHAWRRMMQDYLRNRQQLCGVIQLVDARHPPSRQDHEMIEWLLAEKLAFCLVTTKMDKLRRGERGRALSQVVHALDLPPEQPLVPYSSRTGEGRSELLDWLMHAIAAAGPQIGGR